MEKICVLMGSPRKNGNTNAITKPFIEQLQEAGNKVNTIYLYDKLLQPCIACRNCQKDWSIFGCVHKDDMQQIFNDILSSDIIVLASPIYSWYCTPPMKTVLDRLVYGMNKYYGEKKGPSLWSGKKVAIITTCGYRPEKGADLFEEGIKRYCKHSGLTYLGMLAERHMGYGSVFMDSEKENRAKAFADFVVNI